MSLFLVCGFVVANLAVIDACEERRAENARLALLASLTAPAGAVAVAVARPWGDLVVANAPPGSHATPVAPTA